MKEDFFYNYALRIIRDFLLEVLVMKEKVELKETEVKKENGLTILIYEEYDNLYFANYYFLNNKLIKFRYGFEYP